jgi:hypothetical protein
VPTQYTFSMKIIGFIVEIMLVREIWNDCILLIMIVTSVSLFLQDLRYRFFPSHNSTVMFIYNRSLVLPTNFLYSFEG